MKIKVITAANMWQIYDDVIPELEALSAVTRLFIKRNMKKLYDISDDYFCVISEMEAAIAQKYEDKSELIDPEKDERKVKPEYMSEYRKDREELVAKLNEMGNVEEEVELKVFDLEKELRDLDEKGVSISDKAIEFLSLFDEVNS